MSDPASPEGGQPKRNWFIGWVHQHPRQGIMLGVVAGLLLFAVIRGAVSDEPSLVRFSDEARERWALIQTAQENFFATNGRYAADIDALDGVPDGLQTPREKLHLNISLEDEGTRVSMTLTGRTIRLKRTLENGAEVESDCLVLVSRAGSC